MALAEQSIVTLRNSGTKYPTTTVPRITPQPPIFGMVEALAGTATVLWQTGLRQATIDANVLDELLPADSADITALAGKIVIHAQANAAAGVVDNPAYSGVVLMMYRRDPAGLGNPGESLALVQLVGGGYMEFPASELVAVD